MEIYKNMELYKYRRICKYLGRKKLQGEFLKSFLYDFIKRASSAAGIIPAIIIWGSLLSLR